MPDRREPPFAGWAETPAGAQYPQAVGDPPISGGADTLPPEVSKDYRCVSCLHYSGERATYLCEHRETGQRVIVKTQSGDGKGDQLANEDRLLRQIHATGQPICALWPRPLLHGVFGETEVLIREFIPGESVEAYVESGRRGPGASREWALKCVTSVLRQVSFLHRQWPPIIHRDIKPQNVIIGRDGHFHLIDLGISRRMKQDSLCDTLVQGSALTAPPEQFGYQQTDERSDIYAVGVLLRYCLTQEYGREADEGIDSDLRAVIRKATRFDPAARYQRAEDMLSALEALRHPRKPRKSLRIAAATIVLLAAAALAAFLLPRTPGPYRFREPLIEEAVRRAVGKPEGELTPEDLATVTGLHIFGKQIYTDESEFWFIGQFVLPYDPGMRAAGLWEENGEISSLADIRALPNLRDLFVYRQLVGDLSPVADSGVTRLGIGLNPIADLSPLRGNDRLTWLNLTCLPVSDASVLSTMPNLTVLSLAGTGIRSLRPLSGLPLKELNLVDTDIRDGEVLGEMGSLEKLTFSKLYPGLLMQLKGLRLRELEVTHAQAGVTLRDLEMFPALERLTYSSDEAETVDGAPLRFPLMREFEIKNARIESLSCLAMMRDLRLLNIYESTCADWTGLAELPALEAVYCTDAQRAALRGQYPGAPWLD